MTEDHLDQQLRRYAERWRATQPPPPTPSPPAAVASSSRWRAVLIVAAVVAAVVGMGTGLRVSRLGDDPDQEVLSSDGRGPRGSKAARIVGGVVAWTPDSAPPPVPPSPTTTAPPLTAPPCRGGDLRVARVSTDGASGHQGTFVRLRNVASTTCSLSGYPPTVTATTADGRSLDDYVLGAYFPDPAPAEIAPGNEGLVILVTTSQCEGGEARQGPVYRRVVLGLPGGGVVDLPGDVELDGRCRVAVSRLGGADTSVVDARLPRQPPPGSLATLDAASEPPATVRAGEEFRFVVVLSNRTDTAVALSPCPGYEVRLFAAGSTVSDTRRLNCTAVASIEPGAEVRYEMRLRLPRGTPFGVAKLVWDMKSWGGPVAGTAVEVTGN